MLGLAVKCAQHPYLRNLAAVLSQPAPPYRGLKLTWGGNKERMSPATAKPSIADTFTRLLRLNLGGGPPQISRSRLMEASESRLARAARSGSAHEQLITRPLVSNPNSYRAWATEHARHMDTIASQPTGEREARSLLSTAFALVHRKALFEYLRAHPLSEPSRHLLIQHFHGNKTYASAMVAEHANFQRAFASLLCVEHIGSTLLVHQAFGDPFRRYEHLYAEYFRSYCNSFLAPSDADGNSSDSMRMLLPYLKRDVLDVRSRLLAMPSTAEAGGRAE